MAIAQDLPISAPVRFRTRKGAVEGHIAHKALRHAIVVTHSGAEYNVPWQALSKSPNGTPKRVTLRADQTRNGLRPGMAVSFTHKSEVISGTVRSLGPRRAEVVRGHRAYRVPYDLLSVSDALINGGRQRLAKCAALAEQLLAKHSLKEWSFQFDDATNRAGSCSYGIKVISLARQYCLQASDDQVRNTVLHEIAHAIVGPRHHHNSVWRTTARAIGCTGDRCHTVDFSPPKYIVSCPRCGWAQPRKRRTRGATCKKCSQPVRYAPYIPESLPDPPARSNHRT